jgi:glycosyltransferase involved in cell wall biosynthesis
LEEIDFKTEANELLVNTPLVSAVVPTYNSQSTLENCLESLKLQTYPSIETIVVDNYSEDDTVNIAIRFASRVLQAREFRSAARNYGAEKAGGDYIIFVDSDMQLTSKVIEECVNESINCGADAVMIPEIRVVKGFWGKCRAIERLTYIGDPLIESARFFRREVFRGLGGFDEELEAGEDWDLHARVESAHYKIKSINAHMEHHEERLTLKDIVIKRYRYGKTLMKYIKKHPERARIQFMPIRMNYIRRWRILVNQPAYALGMLFMKSVEYFITAISILSSTGSAA